MCGVCACDVYVWSCLVVYEHAKVDRVVLLTGCDVASGGRREE